MPTTESLRTWADDLYPTETAVELALRAFGVWFAEADQPWVIHEHGGDWIDATVLRFGSGECPLLGISSRQTGWTNHGGLPHVAAHYHHAAQGGADRRVDGEPFRGIT